MTPCRSLHSVLALSLLLAAAAQADSGTMTVARPMAHPPGRTVHPDIPQCIDTNGNLVPCTSIPQVAYWHHGLVANPVVWAIFWTDKVASATQQQIGGFYQAITNSAMFDWMLEYNTDTTDFPNADGSNQRIGRGVYAGAYTINPGKTGTAIGDGDIQNELQAQINAGNIPAPDDNTIYMVYFPAGYVITQGVLSGSGVSCQQFCAYHGTFLSGSQDVFYGVFPDLGSGGCNGVCGPSSVPFKNLCSASSHELFETTTDAEVGLINISVLPPYSKNAWAAVDTTTVLGVSVDTPGAEIGDICNQFTDTIQSVADGTPYVVQQQFSQNLRQCVTSYDFATDYRFYANPNLLVVAPGTTGIAPIYSELRAGSPSSHTLSLSGGLAGVTPSFDKTTLAPSDSTYLRFQVDPNAQLNTEALFTITSNGSAPFTTRTAAVMVRIEPAPTDLTLTPITNGGTVSGVVPLQGTAVAYSSSSLYFVGLYIDGALVASGTAAASYSWNTIGLANGSRHSVILFAEDYDGGNAQLDESVIVANGPKISIGGATAGATVSGTLQLTATGTPAPGGTLSHVTLYVDNTQVAGSSTANAAYAWNTALVANGAHAITATVIDADGQTASATPVGVTVHNLPTVALAPGPGSVSGAVALTVTAAPTHGGALSSLTLSIDGAQVAAGSGSPLSYSWNTALLSNQSSHTLVATATDADGATASATETMVVREPPTVSITRPSQGATLGGQVTVTASATAAAGTTLTSLAISIDGAPLGTGSAATMTQNWDTRQATNGAHVITAVATDADGGSSSASVNVTISNSPAPAGGFTLALDPASGALAVGGAALVFNISTTSTGTAEPITLSVAGLPPGVTSSFSSATVLAGASATLTLQAPAGTAAAPATPFSVGGTSHSVPGGHSAVATVTVTTDGGAGASSGCATGLGFEPLALLGLLPLWLRRRRAALV